MHFKFRNVNNAFTGLVGLFTNPENCKFISRVSSRAGEVLMVDEPVIVTIEEPKERVLFNKARDANPFLHLFESLWMLSGRRDVAPLLKYNSKIGEIASDDGKIFNGAYGERWWRYRLAKDGNGYQQVKKIIDHLKNNPTSRRVVLQIWDTDDDLCKVDWTKDVPCNTHAYFSIRNYELRGEIFPYLDMTVCNRSNDLIWGMLGANVVHFSFLQEYIANCLGIEVGIYNQITNNLHVYLERFQPEKWLADTTPSNYDNLRKIPLVENSSVFNEEVVKFIDNDDWAFSWEEPFLNDVAAPMCSAFDWHKEREYDEAFKELAYIQSDDWRIACENWMEKRKTMWEKKNA